MFSQFVIFCFSLFCLQTHIVRSDNNCYTNYDVRITFDDNLESTNKTVVPKIKPHAQQLSYDEIAHSLLITANLALKLARQECRVDICSMAKYGAPLSGNDINDIAYTALHSMPYGLRLLLCFDVTIKSIQFNEELFADAKHGNKIQTAKSTSDENGMFKWRFELVDNGSMNQLVFRIKNVKTNQYLIADRKRTLVGESLRRIALTDSEKSDTWQLKMTDDLNGNFNKFMIMNVPLGEYLYASRGFCYDNVSNTDDCSTRPSFTWNYETSQEAEYDVYNKFSIDEYVFE